MRCTKAKKLISNKIDGNLDSRQETLLSSHLKKCRKCGLVLEDFKNIKEQSGRLEPLLPPEDMWSRIREKIEARSTAFPARRFSLAQPAMQILFSAAMLLILFVVFVNIRVQYVKRAEMTAEMNKQEYTTQKLREAEPYYETAISALLEAAAGQEKYLDPQVVEYFYKNLEVINYSIASCKEAIINWPEDLESKNLLITSYRAKMYLLSEMLTIDLLSPVSSQNGTIL